MMKRCPEPMLVPTKARRKNTSCGKTFIVAMSLLFPLVSIFNGRGNLDGLVIGTFNIMISFNQFDTPPPPKLTWSLKGTISVGNASWAMLFSGRVHFFGLTKQHGTATTMGHKHGNVPHYLGKKLLVGHVFVEATCSIQKISPLENGSSLEANGQP